MCVCAYVGGCMCLTFVHVLYVMWGDLFGGCVCGVCVCVSAHTHMCV